MSQTDHKLSLKEAIDMTTRFRTDFSRGQLPFAETFNKSIFAELAKQPGCVSIRAYFGMDTSNQVKLIFVGVNDKNEDILPVAGTEGLLFEYGQRCPPLCATGPLNL
jgi:hypothetical protein